MKAILYIIVFMTLTSMGIQAQIQPFPEIPAETLSRKKVIFPHHTRGKFAFLLIAFRRQTQGEVDSWLNPFVHDFAGNKEITFFEIPMISGNWKWMSGWIDSGMRSGVPDEKHDHVATYYGPLRKYFDYLDIRDPRTVYVFLLDKEGRIIWREIGPANENNYGELKSLLEDKTGI
jgi:hypothetical protein